MKKNSSSSNSPGFTLMEVVAVLVILGVLATLAIPRMSSGLSGPNLMETENKLIRDLRMARSHAMSHHIPGDRATVNPNNYDHAQGGQISFNYPHGNFQGNDVTITIGDRTICVLAETGAVRRSACP